VPSPTAKVATFNGDLTETKWWVKTSAFPSGSDHEVVYFKTDHSLLVTYDGSSVIQHGTWRQDGNSVYWETDHKFAEEKGVIEGIKMSGTGKSKNGTWTWTAEKE
jgi:hypothetical protein